MSSSACPQRSKDVQAIFTVVHVKRNCLFVFTALLPASPCINTETVASLADSLNPHNSTNRSIVLGPRISNEFYVLDICRFQLLQLPQITHFPAIDVDNGGSFAENLILIVFRNNARYMFQYVARSSQLA